MYGIEVDMYIGRKMKNERTNKKGGVR